MYELDSDEMYSESKASNGVIVNDESEKKLIICGSSDDTSDSNDERFEQAYDEMKDFSQ